MASSPRALVKSIVLVRYNPENAPHLEKYVGAQCAAGRSAYDLDANLALLKLYQFNAHLFRLLVLITYKYIVLQSHPPSSSLLFLLLFFYFLLFLFIFSSLLFFVYFDK